MMLYSAIFDTYYEWKRFAKRSSPETRSHEKNYTTRNLSREVSREQIAIEPVQLLWCWILQINGTQENEKFGKDRHQSHNLVYNYITCDLSWDLLRK